MRVLLLGAGASHGHGVPDVEKPPLADGFFTHPVATQLWPRYNPLAAYLQKFLNLAITPGQKTDVEQLFQSLESTWRLGVYGHSDVLRIFGMDFWVASPVDWLRGYITDLVYFTTSWVAQNTCPYHQALLGSLAAGDVVISFNYDLMAETTLKRLGLWTESRGYGFVASEGPDSAVTVLKPHGSLNWFRSRQMVEPPAFGIRSQRGDTAPEYEWQDVIAVRTLEAALAGSRSELFDESFVHHIPNTASGAARSISPEFLEDDEFESHAFREDMFRKSPLEMGLIPLLIMPTPNKPYDEMKFAELNAVWQQVRKVLAAADEVIACGFSFRDWHLNQLLFEAASIRSTPLRLVTTGLAGDHESIAKTLHHPRIERDPFHGFLEDFVRQKGLLQRYG